jgi:hypothetical protein
MIRRTKSFTYGTEVALSMIFEINYHYEFETKPMIADTEV